jgi:hypothetical protein
MRQKEFGVKLILILHVSVTSNALRLIKVTDVTRYQGSAPYISRLNMNIDIYTIHIASNYLHNFMYKMILSTIL